MINKIMTNKKTLGLIALITTAFVAILLIFAFQSDSSHQGEAGGIPFSKTQRMLPPVNAKISHGTKEVPDFGNINQVLERKVAFFSYLLPAIQAENQHILAQRDTLLRLHEKVLQGKALTSRETKWLDDLSEYYRVDANDRTRRFNLLLRRVDIVPETLVLIQAANESGWGTSRFAQSALNFFGQWCWTEGCGIVPDQRPSGESYEVRLFNSMEASVKSYIRNLNTHAAYQELRSIRYGLRTNEQPITAVPLTAGLMSYSTRGEDYIHELQQMIRVNRPIIEVVRDELEDNH